MKKILFFSLAVAGMLTSCSSDDSVSMSGNEAQMSSGVPIELSIGSRISTSTRGTGTVGSLTGSSENVWHNQAVKVYMLKKGTMDLAKLTESSSPIYDDETFLTPGYPFPNMAPGTPFGPDSIGLARPENNFVKYYPIEGNFDFYGYRIDDCTSLNTAGKPEVEGANNDSLVVKFQMNGSQDIMAARAYVTDEEKDAAATAGSPLTDENRYYSAYAARRGIQPRLDFKHLMTRVEFEVIPVGADAVAYPGGVLIDSIKVSTDKYKGQFTIAKKPTTFASTADSLAFLKGDFQKILKWDPASNTDFWLMQRDTAFHYQKDTLNHPLFVQSATDTVDNRTTMAHDIDGNLIDYKTVNKDSLALVPLDSVDLRGRTEQVAVGIGEAMFLAPGETEYDVTICMHQWTRKKYDVNPIDDKSNLELTTYSLPAKIKLDQNAAFKQGYSYKVSIKVWGLKEIKLTTTLMGWIDGGGINIAPEEDQNPYGWQ